MQKYANSVQDPLGNAIGTATVSIYTDSAHTTLATLYLDNGVTPVANPLTTNSLGEFSFYAADGRYYIVVSKTGITTQSLDDVILFDSTASTSAASINVTQSGIGHSSTGQSVQDKLRQVISVTDAPFGAKLDGVTDDAQAIQDAFTAANGTGKTVIFPGFSCKIASSISLSNYANFKIDFGFCNITYTGGAGTYLFDMTQAGQITLDGGVFTGTSNGNHFVKTIGSTAALATTYPTVPADADWARRLTFQNISLIQTFATVFDLQTFSREMWISNVNASGNITNVKITGKVANLWVRDSVLYSTVAASQAVVCRGDSGDVTWRYAEGVFLENCICDVVGVTFDLRDVYVFRAYGGQIRSATAGTLGVDVRKGITPITQDIVLRDVYYNSGVKVGTGLVSNFLFQLKIEGGVFSAVQDTAIATAQYAQGVTINGPSFDAPSGTPVAVAIGANNVAIQMRGLHIASSYTTGVTVDSTSVAGVDGDFEDTCTIGVAFGGGSTGVTYTSQVARYRWNGRFISGTFSFVLSSKGSSTGSATLKGFPFTAAADGAVTVGNFVNFNSAFSPTIGITSGATTATVKTGGGGSAAAFTDADFAGTAQISGSFLYQV